MFFGPFFVSIVMLSAISQERLRQEQKDGDGPDLKAVSLLGRLRLTRVGGWVLSDWLSQTLPKYPTRWLTHLRRRTPRYGIHPTDLTSLLTRLPTCCADKPTCPSDPLNLCPDRSCESISRLIGLLTPESAHVGLLTHW